MSISKVKTILISVVGALLVLAAVLFIITPLLGGVNYSALDVLLQGMQSVFAMDFAYGVSLIFLGFGILVVLLLIWWVILLILKKRYRDLFWLIPVVVADFLIFFIMAGLFLVKVDINGNVDYLFTNLLAIPNNTVAVLLASLAIVFVIASVLLLAIFMFLDITASSLEMKPAVVVKEKIKIVKEEAETDDEYYERMIREMGMFHEGEEEAK